MELWGGMECTINRVHDAFFDQHIMSEHRTRVAADLEAVALLGIRTLRVALHWEYYVSTGSWEFFDLTLKEMRRLRLEPIAGLLHHGSGPVGTDLLDPQFPQKLAAYAGQVAERYPWLMRYTPVNEPHTTSRFACLYGHWYPHHRSVTSYLRALLNEVKGTVLAMRSIRSVQPAAELVYTEDGGTFSGTVAVESFWKEREARRWLGTDLLCGKVTRNHSLFGFLTEHGITAEELEWFEANQCPPAVIGLNYYLTSDRFLDDRVELYPSHFRGGDTGSEPLVDIEALRVQPEGIAGAEHILREAWQRYGIPVAITEAHLGGGCDDQIRWLSEVWEGAQRARSSGVDVKAVTVWALFGSWNWSNLCTRDDGTYEPGAFNLKPSRSTPTALAEFVSQLASGTVPEHDALIQQGWWRRDERIEYRASVD